MPEFLQRKAELPNRPPTGSLLNCGLPLLGVYHFPLAFSTASDVRC